MKFILLVAMYLSLVGTLYAQQKNAKKKKAKPPVCTPLHRVSPDQTWQYDELIVREADHHRLDPRLVKSIIAVESQFSPNVVSERGARGLMQVLPGTSSEIGVTSDYLEDPEENVRAGTAYLESLFRAARSKNKHHSAARVSEAVVRRVIAAYHAGPKALKGNNWSKSTRAYVRVVERCYDSDVTALHSSTGKKLKLKKEYAFTRH